MSYPVVGRKAPNFTLPDHAGTPVTLRALRGRWVVLYFYPKDDTSTCTAQACAFRDALPSFEALDAVVLGVSPDPARRHTRFRDKYQLPFTLLSDPDHVVLEAYGVWQEKMLYGRRYMGVQRTTVVIDPTGTVRAVFEKVKVDGHIEALQAVISGATARSRPRAAAGSPRRAPR